MATYLIVRNNDNDSRKTYICNTTHTSQPYIQIKDNCYLDLTTETSSGLQLKLQFKHRRQTHTDTITTGYSGITSGIITTASGYRSTTTFVNRTSTTGYSGRSTYRQTTGYSGKSTFTRTNEVNNSTSTGYPSFATVASTYKGATSSFSNSTTGLENAYASTSKVASGTYSYATVWYDSGNEIINKVTTVTNSSMTSTNTYTSLFKYTSASYTYKQTTLHSTGTRYIYRSTATRTVKSSTAGALLSTTALTKSTSSYRSSTAVGALLSTTALTKTYTVSQTSRYTTTDSSPYYSDFTTSVTGTKSITGYKTSSVPGQLSSTTALTKTQSSIHPGIYIPVQTYSDLIESTKLKEISYSISTTLETSSSRESVYGYSGVNTYNTTVTQTTGYSGRTSSRRTTASGYRSTTTSVRRTSTTGYSGKSFNYKTTARGNSSTSAVAGRTYRGASYLTDRKTWGYLGQHQTDSTLEYSSKTLLSNATKNSSQTIYSTWTYYDPAYDPSHAITSNGRVTLYRTLKSIITSLYSSSTKGGTFTTTAASPYPAKFTATSSGRSSTASKLTTSNAVGALLSTTALTKTYSISQTSKYGTSNYSPYYADFTTSKTGTSMFTNYASSTAMGVLLSTTALTNSQTRTSSSYRSSTAVGNLLTTTALVTSSQYSTSTTGTSKSFSYDTITFLTSIETNFE